MGPQRSRKLTLSPGGQTNQPVATRSAKRTRISSLSREMEPAPKKDKKLSRSLEMTRVQATRLSESPITACTLSQTEEEPQRLVQLPHLSTGSVSESASVREGGKVGSNLEKASPQDRLHHGREIHRGDHSRPGLSGHNRAWMNRCSQYIADFCSGHGGVARAVQKLGLATREWEIEHGSKGASPAPKFCSRSVRTFEGAAFLLLCWPFFDGERPHLSDSQQSFSLGTPWPTWQGR